MGSVIALDVLERFESHLGDLYALFADQFASDRQVSSLFAHMAAEERSHADIVAYQRRLLQQNPDLLAGFTIDVDELYQATGRVRRVREVASKLVAAEAAARALEFETMAAEYHARMALRQVSSELAAFLDQLGRCDEEHRDRLRDLLAATAPAAPSSSPPG